MGCSTIDSLAAILREIRVVHKRRSQCLVQVGRMLTLATSAMVESARPRRQESSVVVKESMYARPSASRGREKRKAPRQRKNKGRTDAGCNRKLREVGAKRIRRGVLIQTMNSILSLPRRRYNDESETTTRRIEGLNSRESESKRG